MTYHDPNLARQTYSQMTYGRHPDKLSEEELVKSHLPLVRKLAWHVHGRMSQSIEIEDLLQIGMVALVEAAKTFEDRGLGFSNYAKLRVRGAMIDTLRKQSSLSRSAMDFRKKLRATQSRLSQELGNEPDEKALAAAMNMDQESFRIALDGSDPVDLKSIDEVYSDQNIWFQDGQESADAAMERGQMQDDLAAAIASLPPRDAMVLQLYFIEEMNLDEIGETLDIGAARVCQIKKAALGKLQSLLSQQ